MTRSILIIIVSLIFIASCRLVKPYKGTEVTTPATFRGDATEDTLSIADKEWKEIFNQPTLQALLDSGIKNNYDMLLAINRLDISRQRMKQAKLLQLPELNLSATAQYTYLSKNSLGGISTNTFLGKSHIENYQAVATLSWEADIWGRIRSQKEATNAEYLQSYEAVKAVQTQLVADIAHGYFNLLMLDRQLEITNRNLSISDSFLVVTRKLKDAGMVNLLAVQQAESQKQATSILIPQLQQEIALQENALKILTGQLPDAVERAGAMNEILNEENISAGIPAQLISRRPDVRAAEMAIVASNARMGIAKANMYPALNITAGGGFETFKASNWFNIPNSLFGFAAGSIVQPVFQRNRLKTDYEIAKLEREQAVIIFKQQVLNAVGEVSDALAEIEYLREQEQVAVARVDTLILATANARLLFSSDLADYLEVLAAQGNAIRAELELAAIQRSQADALINLYRALGGGWK